MCAYEKGLLRGRTRAHRNYTAHRGSNPGAKRGIPPPPISIARAPCKMSNGKLVLFPHCDGVHGHAQNDFGAIGLQRQPCQVLRLIAQQSRTHAIVWVHLVSVWEGMLHDDCVRMRLRVASATARQCHNDPHIASATARLSQHSRCGMLVVTLFLFNQKSQVDLALAQLACADTGVASVTCLPCA